MVPLVFIRDNFLIYFPLCILDAQARTPANVTWQRPEERREGADCMARMPLLEVQEEEGMPTRRPKNEQEGLYQVFLFIRCTFTCVGVCARAPIAKTADVNTRVCDFGDIYFI